MNNLRKLDLYHTTPTTPNVSKCPTVILDPGHGINTIGKRSPDGEVYEYSKNREILLVLAEKLEKKAFRVKSTVPAFAFDFSLGWRAKYVNDLVKLYGKENVILISLHCNADSEVNYTGARGFSSYVYRNCSAESKKFSSLLWLEVATESRFDFKGNRRIPNKGYIDSNLYILKKTTCPAVLAENLFMTNRFDCMLLNNEKAIDALTDCYVRALEKYFSI